MVQSKRWGQIVAIVILGLAVTCVPAQAQTFSAPKNVSNNSDFSFTPQIAVDGNGNMFMAWEDDTSNNSNILFSRSTDGGATFSAAMNLSQTSGFSFNPRIAVDGKGGVNVVWEDSTPGNTVIMFSRSTDGGVTFSTAVNVSNSTASAGSPEVAADANGNLFVVWENDSQNLGILFSRSTDGGATFSAPIFLSTNTAGSVTPQIAADLNGNLSVVWEDDFNGASDISFSESVDHGTTFSTPKSLSLNIGNSVGPQIALDLSGNIDVVWTNNSPGHFDAFFTRSADKGATFSIPQNLSNGTGDANTPQVAVDAGGNINAVWSDNVPPDTNPDIYYARSSDGGATFSGAQNVSNNTGFSANPWLTVDAGANINVGWEDNTPGNQDIFFARSINAGATFSTPQDISNDSGMSIAVQMSADKNGNINATWQDNTPGISQIFFSRLAGTIQNQRPVANAGPDQTVQATSQGSALVQLDGSKSSDPDGDVLSFVWKDQAGNVVGTTAIVDVTLTPGTYTYTLTVTDPGGLSSTASTLITVLKPNLPPVADAGADQTLRCAGPGGARVTLDGSKSSDPDGDTLSFVWKDEAGNVVGMTAVAQLTVTVGTHTFTLIVTDSAGLSDTATTQVTVGGTAPPSLQVMLSPNVLWPPNHRLVQITATIEANDACDANPAVALVSITSNEPDNGLGDGDQPNDIQAIGGGSIQFGTDVRSFLLRAERSGTGTGRIYTVTYTAKDASGNKSTVKAQVTVPKAEGPSPPRHQRFSKWQ
ncbi:MAG TPA: PKD domain-containing protein [Candidatus Acidoferrales bacterium]|nr:PKD domain-containing protein [Candidatus Acidoferrales bacterium]